LRCTQYLPLPSTHDASHADHVDCIEFEVDDQSAEDLAVGLDQLRERADVLQVFQIPAFGKKGRMAVRIQVLARAGSGEAVSQACFEQTTTIGLRLQRVERRTLSRTELPAATDSARVKVCERAGTLTAKAEMDDLARVPGGHADRERVRRVSEKQALSARASE
jgi:uncharacterized protein (DUF111 family)